MINIKPVSDLRNNYTEIEAIVKEGEAVYLTKNGQGTMVVMSIEHYSMLTEDRIEYKLDEADMMAQGDSTRLGGDEIFAEARARVNAKK